MHTNHDKDLSKLTDLLHLDMDAVLAYDQAIKNLAASEVEIVDALEGFQDDHLHHIDNLSEIIRIRGGEVPKFKRDAKGFFIEGMTAAMSKIGTRATLIVMTENEMLTNVKYKAACSGDFSQEVLALCRKNFADEQRHIAFITKALKEKFGMSQSSVTRPSAENLEESMSL